MDFNTPLAIVAGLLTDTATQCVSILLSAGASVNGLPQSAVRPLIAAAASGHIGTVELLLQREPEVNIRNKVLYMYSVHVLGVAACACISQSCVYSTCYVTVAVIKKFSIAINVHVHLNRLALYLLCLI